MKILGIRLKMRNSVHSVGANTAQRLTSAQRNFGISPSDDYEDTEEDKELRAFCRSMYGPSIDKFVERNFGLDADGNPLASSSASKDADKAASSKKKAQTTAATLKK